MKNTILLIFIYLLFISCRTFDYNNKSYFSLDSSNVIGIEIESMLKDSCIYTSTENIVRFTIHNKTEENYWIGTVDLMFFLEITDTLGIHPQRKNTMHDKYPSLPEFILAKSKDSISVDIPTIAFMRSKYDINKEYIYQPTYYCHKKSRKRKTDYKTLIGKHYIKPFKFKICE